MLKGKINPFLLFFFSLIIFIVYCVIKFDLSTLSQNRILTNIKVLSTLFFGLLLPILIVSIVTIGIFTNKWAFRIERVSFGGFNILFDNPVKLYKRSVRSFLDTKRTLFKIDFQRDNFDETMTSYYKTYEFFRNEMKILESEKKKGRWSKHDQKELYDMTNRIIQTLNEFLTTHQNNYRRWYKQISDSNKVERRDRSGELVFHLTPINEIQKHYYRYEELCKGFEEVNKFFCSEVRDTFQINLEKWGRNDTNA